MRVYFMEQLACHVSHKRYWARRQRERERETTLIPPLTTFLQYIATLWCYKLPCSSWETNTHTHTHTKILLILENQLDATWAPLASVSCQLAPKKTAVSWRKHKKTNRSLKIASYVRGVVRVKTRKLTVCRPAWRSYSCFSASSPGPAS